jgi:hypothetical protein
MSAEVEAPPKTEQVVNPVTLSSEILTPGLSLIHRTLDGAGYSFTKLSLPNQRLQDISILSSFVYLRHAVK